MRFRNDDSGSQCARLTDREPAGANLVPAAGPVRKQLASLRPLGFGFGAVGQGGSVFPAGCEIAVLHGDPAQPNADVFFKVGPGYSIPHHWHTSVERMTLVSGRLRVTYDGHEPTTLEVGTYAYGPAGAPHTGECLSKEPSVLFVAFEGPVDVQTKPASN